MRKYLITAVLLLCTLLAGGQERRARSIQTSRQETPKTLPALPDTIRTDFPDEYLDTVVITRSASINNYSMIGFSAGITNTSAVLNPKTSSQIRPYVPGYWAIWYTHHEKMFDYLPYFAFQVGFAHGVEGYQFKPAGESETVFFYPNDLCGKVEIETFEIPVMMQLHVDTDFMKYTAALGVYGGYRTSIHRTISPNVANSVFAGYTEKFYKYENDFYPWDIRWDYGLQAGAGIGFIFSPIEIHLGVQARYGLSSFFQPDSQYPEDSSYADRNKVYYRFATPFDLIYNVSIHYHLTKRNGKTLGSIKRQAKEIVYGPQL